MYFEKRPIKTLRNKRLLAIIGAGVLVATTTYSAVVPSDHESGRGAVRRGDETAPVALESYPVHEGILTTIFWVGEGADNSNDFIHNRSSAWVENWVGSFGGIDDPDDRCGYRPCDFVPKENTFYFALPVSDYNEMGIKPASQLEAIPWYEGQSKEGESILKNRWIEITYQGKKAYAQWEDVGPFGEDDVGYVFGSDRPEEPRAGLDVSPAVSDYLNIDGKDDVSWRFIEESEVPAGPWKDVITRSGPQF